MNIENIVRVPRPKATSRSNSFASKLAATIASGDALSVPLNGETYAVLRNRLAGNGGGVARRHGAALRTLRSDDGLSIVIWLEPKA